MRISNIEQLKQVPFGTNLYLINPYSQGWHRQEFVKIETFKVGCLSHIERPIKVLGVVTSICLIISMAAYGAGFVEHLSS